MNDFNRRGFLATLTAAVTGLFVKRTEASANDLDKHAQVVPQQFFHGDVVRLRNCNAWGVVLGSWAQEGKRRTLVNCCAAGEVFDTDVWEDDLEPVGPLALFNYNVNRDMEPGGYIHFAEGFVLCKPTEAVEAGQLLTFGRMGKRADTPGAPFIERIAHWHAGSDDLRVLGIATRDCAPGEWVWCVPQVKKTCWASETWTTNTPHVPNTITLGL